MLSSRSCYLPAYNHPFFRYLVVGGSTFLLDFGILYLLHGVCNLNLGASTSVAYWLSISYNFFLNRYWTFSHKEKESLKKHVSGYFILLIANYLFTVAFVSIVGEHINYIAAKALAVAIQMTWTYYIYKRYIFTE
jgi:putative flippase GtrA